MRFLSPRLGEGEHGTRKPPGPAQSMRLLLGSQIPVCCARSITGWLRNSECWGGGGGEEAGTGGRGGGGGWVHADPQFSNCRSRRTPGPRPVKTDCVTHCCARKWSPTPAPWGPSELPDPTCDLVRKSPLAGGSNSHDCFLSAWWSRRVR